MFLFTFGFIAVINCYSPRPFLAVQPHFLPSYFGEKKKIDIFSFLFISARQVCYVLLKWQPYLSCCSSFLYAYTVCGISYGPIQLAGTHSMLFIQVYSHPKKIKIGHHMKACVSRAYFNNAEKFKYYKQTAKLLFYIFLSCIIKMTIFWSRIN